jgi:flavin reductase (DIM6/NTAB) family NADH-FMN oxidoreductase RutF
LQRNRAYNNGPKLNRNCRRTRYKAHYTNAGITENGTFSVNIPSVHMAEKVDYCGLVSGRRVDKSALFETFYGKLKTAPMIRECPFSAECRLIQTVELPMEQLFVGEIVAAYSEDRYLTAGTPDMAKMNPLLPDSIGWAAYWRPQLKRDLWCT